MPSPATEPYDWIVAITSIAFIFSAFGNGANDVANAYATSVAARTLTMPQVGFLSMITEFAGAVGLGARVTSTIKNNIINIDRYTGRPAVLMLVMCIAEVASATWLMGATRLGFPVSTTQTIVGSLIGVGFASESDIEWSWTGGSVTQVAASWGIAPAIACGFSALLFGTVKYAVLEREDSFKWAMRLIPFYLAGTGGILALFITIEAPTAPSLEEFGAGKAAGIVLGSFFGVLAIAYIFFMPYFERRLIKKDARVKFYHVPLGPLLRRENPPLYWPSKDGEFVINYYEDAYGEVRAGQHQDALRAAAAAPSTQPTVNAPVVESDGSPASSLREKAGKSDLPSDLNEQDILERAANTEAMQARKKKYVGPYDRFIAPVKPLSWFNPQKWYGYFKFALLQGVTRDVVSHDSALLRAIHARAHRYDVRVEHLWTYCQVVSAMMMSIAHGSNDVANAVGPWSAVYQTWQTGDIDTRSATPVWMLVVAGLLLGLGFWFYGYNIMRAVGNRITQMSPTRGFATELGAAITVLLASRLGLPVSTTQCLVGASIGVALMNYDLGAVNWRQLAWIFLGWLLTLPSTGLISGVICLMALNTPHF